MFILLIILYLFLMVANLLIRMTSKDFFVFVKNFSWTSPESRKILFEIMKETLFMMMIFIIGMCATLGAIALGVVLGFLFSK